MVTALATDFAYLITALWESSPAGFFQRRWAQYRYARLAPRYDSYIEQQTGYGAPLQAALGRIPTRPRRILDVSTGTGYAAVVAAGRYPEAVIAACDLSPVMLSRARVRLPGAVVCSDSGRLPFADGAFDLVILQNAPPQLRELVRMVASGGWLILAFSAGRKLPTRLKSLLGRRLCSLGLDEITRDDAGDGFFVVASRPSESTG